MSEVTVTTEGRVSVITINRPEKRNAINQAVAVGLQEAFAEFDASDQRAAVLTGAGELAFSGGADVTDVPELWRCVPTIGITTEKPIVCAIDGWCVGGAMVMVALSDLAVCTERAQFVYPEGKVGFTGGMIAALAGRIAHKHAMELILLGRTVDGRRAYEMGLVNEVVVPGQHVEAAIAMAQEAASMAPLVTSTLKRFVTEHTLPQTPSEQMARTMRDLGSVNTSRDRDEGIAAFLEKRPPNFEGR